MSGFLCFDTENSLFKFVQVYWTNFALLNKYDAYIEEDCLEGHHWVFNSY
jgi:hypothetical protein